MRGPLPAPLLPSGRSLQFLPFTSWPQFLVSGPLGNWSEELWDLERNFPKLHCACESPGDLDAMQILNQEV